MSEQWRSQFAMPRGNAPPLVFEALYQTGLILGMLAVLFVGGLFMVPVVFAARESDVRENKRLTDEYARRMSEYELVAGLVTGECDRSNSGCIRALELRQVLRKSGYTSSDIVAINELMPPVSPNSDPKIANLGYLVALVQGDIIPELVEPEEPVLEEVRSRGSLALWIAFWFWVFAWSSCLLALAWHYGAAAFSIWNYGWGRIVVRSMFIPPWLVIALVLLLIDLVRWWSHLRRRAHPSAP